MRSIFDGAGLVTKKKKIIIGAAVFGVLVICSVAAFLIINFAQYDDMRGRLDVYFFNAAAGRLEAELHSLPQVEPHLQIDLALRHFAFGPESSALSGVWPQGVSLREFLRGTHLEDGVLIAEFSELYDELSPLEEVIFRAAFTLTMVGIPYVESVLFRTGYENEWFESAASITNNPFISPARRTATNFTLFFADESGEGLITVIYSAEDVNVHTRAQYILALLIEGQNAAGVMPLIPPETHVRDVFVEADLGIYVNLSSEFHSRFTGTTAQARMMLQSITHTMLENADSNVRRRVFFLIDSERWEDFHGVSDFHLGFTVDKTMMLDYESEPYETEEEAT